MLHLEGGNDGVALKPKDVDQLNGLVSGIVELPGQFLSKMRDVLETGSVVRSVPIVSGYPDVETQVGAELEGISQNKPWISVLGNLFLDARHISKIVVISMEVLVKKGGIIELPNSIMAELGISEGKKVFLNIKDGKILINPAKNIAEKLAGSIALDDVDLIDEIIESEDWL